MTATVRLAGENHQPFSALWRFEQGQVLIRHEQMTKVPLAKHHHMVNTVPADRSDEPLRTTVLPG
jgi:hypothetical protein